MYARFFFIMALMGIQLVFSQQTDTIAKRGNLSVPSVEATPKDSIGTGEMMFDLEEVLFFGNQPFFRDEAQRRKYELLRYRVKKVYPYAKMAADKLYSIERTLDSLPSHRQKKKYTKQIQEETEARFTDELKKLSRSSSSSTGRRAIRLMTWSSTYAVVGGLFGITIRLGSTTSHSRVSMLQRVRRKIFG